MINGKIKHNMKEVIRALPKAAQDRREDQYDVLLELMLSTYTFISVSSPVDTGRYRANHTFIKNMSPYSVTPTQIVSNLGVSEMQLQRQKMMREIQPSPIKPARKTQIKYAIVNALPYAWPLERGHSPQRRQGIYGPARERFITLYKRHVGSI